MTRPRFSVIALLSVALVWCARGIAAEKEVAFSKAILGSWTIERYDVSGTVTKAFDNNHLEFGVKSVVSWATSDGATFDGTYTLGGESGGGVKIDVAWDDDEIVWKGLAKIVDGKLCICVASDGVDRPSAFTSVSNTDLTIVVLRRGR